MTRSILERLFAAVAVLFAAAATGRKSSRAYRKAKTIRFPLAHRRLGGARNKFGSKDADDDARARDALRGKKKTRRKPGKRPSKKRQKKSASRAARRVSRKGRRREKKSAKKVKAQKLAAAHKESPGGEPLPRPTPPIGRAILISPEDGKYVDSVNPTFRWLSVGGATRYEVLWGEDPGLSNGHSTISLATEATVPVEKPLRVGATYYWRVRGGNDGGWGPWSPTASFRVLEETT